MRLKERRQEEVQVDQKKQQARAGCSEFSPQRGGGRGKLGWESSFLGVAGAAGGNAIPGTTWLWQPGWGRLRCVLISCICFSRATLDPLVPLVLLEKMAPKVLEETAAPLAVLVTLASKVLPDPLARRESLEMMVPL